jgi:hypothetical protein
LSWFQLHNWAARPKTKRQCANTDVFWPGLRAVTC